MFSRIRTRVKGRAARPFRQNSGIVADGQTDAQSIVTSTPLADELSLVESLSKLFAASLGSLYLIGFLVVACHLSRYGVSSFAVLQLQYLIAGIWTLGPIVLHASIGEVEHRFSERATPEVKGKFNWRRFVFSLLSKGSVSGVFLGLLARIPNVADNLTWGIGIRILLFYLSIWTFAQLFWGSRRVVADKETWWTNRSHAAPYYLTALFVLVLGYAVWFSVRIYPLIPFSLGGGEPLTVAFFEGEKKMPDEIQKPVPSAKRSVPYKLLLATDKYYVVVSPSDKEQSLEINRDSVAGMIVLASN
jgi:hypothetical protein